MYNSFFQLNRDPFPASPSLSNYFTTEGTENIRNTITRAIKRDEGPCLLIGSPGTGKSILCQIVADDLQTDFHVVSLNCGRLDSRSTLLRSILYQLEQPYREMEEGELRLSLIDFVNRTDTLPLLLIIDEADTLPLRLLDELRLLTNIISDGRSQVRLLLAGGLVLEERFASPRLASLNQRIAKRCYLESFQREETAHYIQFQLESAGSDNTIFDEQAMKLIHQTTDGIPRLINQLSDHTLLMASLGGHKTVDAAGISEAWADLQQLPGPTSQIIREEIQGNNNQDDLLEFGTLESDSAPAEQAIPFEKSKNNSSDGDMKPRPRYLASGIEESEYRLKIANIEEDFLPRQEAPEMELVFDQPNDPFSESFEEVEVVLDHYATMKQDKIPASAKVISKEGEEIASLLQSSSIILEQQNSETYRVDPSVDVVMPNYETNDASGNESLNPAVTVAFNAYPELPTSQNEPTLNPSSESLIAKERADDRDLLIVDAIDSKPTVTGKVKPVPARKQEFRQLFTNLRRDQA